MAIATLARIAEDKKAPAAAQVAAANALLDRAWGRPQQRLEHSGEGGPVEAKVTIEFVEPSKRDDDD